MSLLYRDILNDSSFINLDSLYIAILASYLSTLITTVAHYLL